jgi:hypothetical protein
LACVLHALSGVVSYFRAAAAASTAAPMQDPSLTSMHLMSL